MKFKKKDVIIKVVKPNEALGRIDEGQVCVIIDGRLRQHRNKVHLKKGNYFDDSVAFSIASEETKVIIAPLAKIEQATPGIGEKIARNLEVKKEPEPKSKKLTYLKQVKCPVCESNFTVTKYFSYKLEQKSIDRELRVRYKDAEPLLYDLWRCSGCNYTNFQDSFHSLGKRELDELKRACRPDGKKQAQLNRSPRVDLKQDAELKAGGETIQDYNEYKKNMELHIAIENHLWFIKNFHKYCRVQEALPKLYLHLAWLYDDVKNEEKAREARMKALLEYDNVYSKSRLTLEAQYKILYLIARLNHTLGYKEKALNNYRKCLSLRVNNRQINMLAEEAVSEIKRELNRQ